MALCCMLCIARSSIVSADQTQPPPADMRRKLYDALPSSLQGMCALTNQLQVLLMNQRHGYRS